MDYPTVYLCLMAGTIIRKKEGLKGQKGIVIPRPLLKRQCAGHEVTGNLYVTDIGYYPRALHHYRERPKGAEQQIFIYCHEGYGSISIDEIAYDVGPGEFALIPKKTPHRYAASPEHPWTIYWFHFTGTAAGAIVAEFAKQFDGVSILMAPEKFITTFDEIYSRFERGYASDNLLVANMALWQLLATALGPDTSRKGRTEKSEDTTTKVIDYLQKHIENALTVQQMAAQVNLSPSHFSYLFRKKTGFTPIEYFNHLKMQKACQYLMFTELRIKEISGELGIEDQYYFSRLFSKVMGLSPQDYRRKRHL